MYDQILHTTGQFYAMSTCLKFMSLTPDDAIGFFNLPKPSSCTRALWSIQPLGETGTRNLPKDKRHPDYTADNLTTIYELTV
jgi:hypothetical protein